MRSTSLAVSIPLLCALSTVVFCAPAHAPGRVYSRLPEPDPPSEVRPHIGFSQNVEEQRISIQSSDFDSVNGFEFDTDGYPSKKSDDDDDLPAETPFPTTHLMEASYEKGQEKSEGTDQLSQTTYWTPSKHGTFYPPVETWSPKLKSKASSAQEQPLFSSPLDPETTPHGLLDSFVDSKIFNFDLELDAEALLIWASMRPVWAWVLVGCLFIGLGVVAAALVEVAGLIVRAVRCRRGEGEDDGNGVSEKGERIWDEKGEDVGIAEC